MQNKFTLLELLLLLLDFSSLAQSNISAAIPRGFSKKFYTFSGNAQRKLRSSKRMAKYKLILGCMFLSSCISSSLYLLSIFLLPSCWHPSEIVLLIHKYTHNVHTSVGNLLLSSNPLYFIAVNIFSNIFASLFFFGTASARAHLWI